MPSIFQRVSARIRRLVGSPPFEESSGLVLGSFGQFELAYRKGTADEAVIRQTFERDRYFAETPEYQPRDGDTIVDIGAHIGAFSLHAASRIGAGRVHAIEPSGDTFNLLRINVALNRRSNVTPHRLAITDRDGTCTLYHSRRNWGHSVVKQHSRRTETVASSTLAGFFDRNGIGRCSFLKLNCEGAEFPILLSTPPAVLERIDLAVVLYHGDAWTGNTEADLVSHLQSGGFQCAIRNQLDKRGWIIASRNGARRPSP